VVDRALLNSGGRTMTNERTLESLQSLTREQLVKRIVFLERVTLTASQNAERFGKQAEKIGALARAIKRTRVALADRIALVEAVEYLAATAESDATLDKQCIEFASTCSPDEWDQFEASVTEDAATSTKH
jgi:hypothetical protein